jgi:phage gp36-like protein
MAYLTPLDMIARYGAGEIVGRADRSVPPRVTPELLIASARGEDLIGAGFPEDAIAAAQTALAIIVSAISDGQSEVDSYLASRYAVPLASPPGVILRFTGDVARYTLYDDHATEEVARRYADAIKFLQAVAKGAATVDVGPDAEAPAGGLVEMISAGRIFSRAERGL